MPEQIERCVEYDQEEHKVAQVKYDEVHAIGGDGAAVDVVEDVAVELRFEALPQQVALVQQTPTQHAATDA